MIKTFSLDFASNTILSCFLFIAPVIAKLFDCIAELVISKGMPEANAEMKTHSVIVEITVSKF